MGLDTDLQEELKVYHQNATKIDHLNCREGLQALYLMREDIMDRYKLQDQLEFQVMYLRYQLVHYGIKDNMFGDW